MTKKSNAEDETPNKNTSVSWAADLIMTKKSIGESVTDEQQIRAIKGA